MRILITNAYTWGNKGDAGILLGTIDVLRKLYGQALEVDILTFSPQLDGPHYLGMPNVHGVYENVICPYGPNPLHVPVSVLNLLKGMKQRIGLSLHAGTLPGSDSYKAIGEADYVIACGGGYLGGDSLSLNYLHLFLIDTCLKLHKKVVMVGNSVEPSRNLWVKKRLKETLSKLDAVFARENITYDFLTEDLNMQNVRLIPDMAFMLEPAVLDFKLREKYAVAEDRLLIGITVRSCSDDPQEVKKYMQTIAKVISRVILQMNASFVFIPQVRFREDDDFKIAESIRALLDPAYRDQFILMGEDYSPGEIKSIIGQCDLFFGTRMHSNIFATSMAVPTVAIAYEKKTNGIMHMLELDDYVLDVNSLNAEQCMEKISHCVKNRLAISQHLRVKIPEIQRETEEAVLGYLKSKFPG